MRPPAKLAAYGLILGIALGGGAAAGKAVGPTGTSDDTSDTSDHDEHGATTPKTEEDPMPAGTLISQDGYTLVADSAALDGAPGAPFGFRITGPDGAVVRDFVSRHDRELHLILVGTDLATYAHLHPSRAEDGTWSVDLPALAPGVYRAFADFAAVDGPELTLGVDVTVAGDAVFAPLPEANATAEVDGYEVTMTGSPVAGEETELSVAVSRDGKPVYDLEPYLGAFGHLVAIRGGDLAYLHVHPLGDEAGSEGNEAGGPEVRFAVHVPSPGDYRLFFDFSHDGTVRTAAFTVHVTAAGGAEAHAGSNGHG